MRSEISLPKAEVASSTTTSGRIPAASSASVISSANSPLGVVALGGAVEQSGEHRQRDQREHEPQAPAAGELAEGQGEDGPHN